MTVGELEMMVKVNTQGLDDVKKKLNDVSKTSKDTQFSIGKMAAGFVSAQAVIGIATKAASLFVNAIKDGIQADIESTRTKKLLIDAMQRTSTYTKEAYEEIIRYSSELQRMTIYDDDAILAGQKLLVTFGAHGQALKDLTKATLDLATAKGMNLQSAFDLVSKTIGSSTNALGRYGVQVEGAAGSTERMQNAVDSLSKLFGGSAFAEADTLYGKLKQLNEANNDIFQTIGSALTPVIKVFVEEMLNGSNSINDFLSKKENMQSLFKIIKSVGLVIYGLAKAIQLNFKVMYDFMINPFIIAGKVLWEFIKPLGSVWEKITGLGSVIMDKLKPAMEFFSKIFTWVKKGAIDLYETVKEKTAPMLDKILPNAIEEGSANALRVLQDELKKTGKSYVDFTKEVISGTDKLLNLEMPDLTSGITGGGGGGNGGGSAPKKEKGSGVNISGFTSGFSAISDAMAGVQDSILGGFTDIFDKLTSKTASFADKFTAIFTAIGTTTMAVLDIVGAAMDDYFNSQIEKLGETHDIEIEKIEERLARELELIEYNGMTKAEYQETELARLQELLAAETDATEQANLQEAISEITKQMAIYNAEEKAKADKEKSDKKYAKKKYQAEVEAFNVSKGIAAANAAIQYALGLVSVWSGFMASPGGVAGAVLAGVFTGVLTGIFAAQLATILAKQPPPAPRFERGGTVRALVGERGSEMVDLPVGSNVYNADDTKNMMQRQPVYVAVYLDSEEMPIKRVLLNNRESERYLR